MCDADPPPPPRPQAHAQAQAQAQASPPPPRPQPQRRQSQHSDIAKSAIMRAPSKPADASTGVADAGKMIRDSLPAPFPSKFSVRRPNDGDMRPPASNRPHAAMQSVMNGTLTNGTGRALTDTPVSTAPNTAPSSPRIRPTTLDIPGLTKSKVSPDGRISSRDIGSKLVIVMVGLPARGKSYITKKTARYLNWLQHDTRIFNVGERRRVAAGGPLRLSHPGANRDFTAWREASVKQIGITTATTTTTAPASIPDRAEGSSKDATILTNGRPEHDTSFDALPPPATQEDLQALADRASTSAAARGDEELSEANVSTPEEHANTDVMEHSAYFFDPKNVKAAQIREQVAMSTLDELLDFILDQGGSVGILDATNSTLERRKLIMKRVRERAGPELGVLFLESLCEDENLLESNMRLKLSGPDYKDQDPVAALADFKRRVAIYQRNYVPLGDFEEKNNMQYVQMIDVGRKIVSHQIRGFLAAQTVYYLVNFNLSPRQIWITRHGESTDNVEGKIGGNSGLSENGRGYAKALTRFIDYKRKEWAIRQREKVASTHFPPRPGDTTPPNPEYTTSGDGQTPEKNFCVWTSMLHRSIQTAQFFDEEEYDIKQMKMLDELNAGDMEGMTYEEIRTKHADEYELRRHDKLHYRYPGAGGEGYLDIINRLRAVIVEVERMTDHVLLVGHRSVARVLLAYFVGLKREDVADLDVPLGILYMLEPKPYGVDFKAFRYNASDDWFHYEPDYALRRATSHAN
ncbi:MAG: hypothetical protein M1838_001532 [Thelocarpon superellum]|nr:MAG: hypothetical protein M1838_001532 [Thelocarpon superellum]